MVLALLLGACDNSTGGDDGLSAAQTVAEEFRVVWDHVLGKSIERAALGDEADVEEALEEWETLDGGAQAELAAEKTKLESLRAEISSLKSSVAALRTYLEGKPDNSAHNPYPVSYTGRAAPAAIYKALAGAGKYVSLDLSGSAVAGFVHDTEPGRALVVDLVLPDSLEEIENGATLASVFSGFANLRTVSASGLRRLGSVAFAYCSSLAEVNLPEAASIGSEAFYDCASLAAVNLPKAASIGTSAFDGCARLTGAGIALPESITAIGAYVFANCGSLADITLPPGITSIGRSAFQNSGLVSITLPSGVASIGPNAFEGCAGLVSITLPAGLTSIGAYAFQDCSSLAAITLPPGITSIEKNTFWGCAGLSDIMLPEVATIGEGAFRACAGLVAISLPKAMSLGSMAFSSCKSLTTADLPKATSLGRAVFNSCSSLTTVNLPEAVSIDDWMFYECSSLVTLDLPKVTFLGGDLAQTFYGCTGLTTITLGTIPPAIDNRARIFEGAATTAKTITFKVPDAAVYTAAGSPWSDKIGLNTAVGDYWDFKTDTKGNLTVALAAIDG
jgi:hypothetical protein